MRLDYLCDMQLTLNESSGQARPTGEEGSLFALGGGTVAGERLRGRLRCANSAHRRSDGAMQPDVHGVITTDDNATIQSGGGATFTRDGLSTRKNSPRLARRVYRLLRQLASGRSKVGRRRISAERRMMRASGRR